MHSLAAVRQRMHLAVRGGLQLSLDDVGKMTFDRALRRYYLTKKTQI